MDQIRISRPDWEMVIYSVTGTNPQTNRRKSETVFVLGEDEEEAKRKSGLVDIITVERCRPEPPSERQINYGNDLGIPYSESYSKRDYSCLISYATDEDVYIPIEKAAAKFAVDNGIYLPQFASMTMLYGQYYANLTLKEAIAFFAFTVYQFSYGFNCYDYRDHPKLDLFEKFADENIDNDDFTRSLLRYDDITQFIPNYGKLRKTTNAYKICSEFIEAHKTDVSGQEPVIVINKKAEEPADNDVPKEELKPESLKTDEAKAPDNKPPEEEKKSNSKIGIVAIVVIVIFGIMLFACNAGKCTKSESSSSYSSKITITPATGKGGLTASSVESFFEKNVPDAKYVLCHIRDNGDYSLDFTLSNTKSEWETNYDEFALSVKKACDDFEKTYSAKANIFSIWFFLEDNSHIYWLSTDGGENGKLCEKFGNSYDNETTMSFDDLVKHYAAKR